MRCFGTRWENLLNYVIRDFHYMAKWMASFAQETSFQNKLKFQKESLDLYNVQPATHKSQKYAKKWARISMKTNDKSRLISLYINERCDISRKHFTNCSFDIKQHMHRTKAVDWLLSVLLSVFLSSASIHNTLECFNLSWFKKRKKERERKWQKNENIYAIVCSLQQLNCWKRAVKSEFYSLKHTSW